MCTNYVNLQLGMGSALETLCEQAFGAKQFNMLGIYLQRSWVILNTTALLLCLFYIFATPLLKLIGETSAISEAAGIALLPLSLINCNTNDWFKYYEIDRDIRPVLIFFLDLPPKQGRIQLSSMLSTFSI